MNEQSYDLKKIIRTYLVILLAYAVLAGIFSLGVLGYTVNVRFIPSLWILLSPLYPVFLLILGYGATLVLAYIASRINEEEFGVSKLFSVFQKRTLSTNLLALFVRWVAISVLAVPLGILLVLLTPVLMDTYAIFRSVPVVILFWFLAFLPAMMVATLFSMVPYLLADPDFDQMENNVLKTSIKMIKTRLLRIFALRFVFLFWFVALGATIPFYTLEMYAEVVGGDDQVFSGQFQVLFEVAVLVTVMIIIPIYQMMHGVIYTKLKPDQES